MKTDPKEQARKAFNEGIIYAYDCSEAEFSSQVIKENESAALICKEQLKDWYFKEENEEEEGTPLDEEDFNEFMESLIFYVYTGKSKPKNIKEAIRLTIGKSFWMPRYVWVKGEFFDTYNMPSKDEKGNINGIRL